MALLADRRAAIEDEILRLDTHEYSHNIISLELAMIAAEHTNTEANRAITDLGLDELGWSVENDA